MQLLAVDSGLWFWVERASWVTVTVSLLIGMLAVAYQVRQLRFDQGRWSEQQRRLADEISKAPKLIVGFIPDESAMIGGKFATKIIDNTALTATWPNGSDDSNPIDIKVFIFNDGERSAKDLDVEMRFNKGVTNASSDSDGITSVRPDGTMRWYREGLNLNPSVWQAHTFAVRVPKTLTEVKIAVVGSMDNYPRFEHELIIRIEYRGTS